MDTGIIIKEDGAKQRTDVELTKAIAGALGNLILLGKPITPRKGMVKLSIEGEEGVIRQEEVSTHTVHGWLNRDVVIPETGESLKSFVETKREEKRANDEQLRQSTIVENAESQLLALSGIKIKPIESKKTYRYIQKGEKLEKVLVKEETIEGSAKMAEVVVKGLQFGLERLNPQRYGPKAEVQHNHFIFDLAKLRKARQERDASRHEIPA